MRDYLLLHLVILTWGFTAILGKLISLPPVEVVVWRTLLAGIGFALLARFLKKSLHIPAVEMRKMLAVGAILGLHWVLFFASARLATASVSLAALPTAMLWCSLIEPWVDGTRKWRPLELLVGLLIVAAVMMIYHVETRYWLGFSLGIGAALLAALYLVINKQLVAHWHYSVMGAYQMTGAFAMSLVGWVVLPSSPQTSGHAVSHPHGMTLPTAMESLWLLILAILCTVGAYAGYMHVLKKLSVFTVNVIYNLEPIYGIVLAVLIFGSQEHMSPGFYLGAGIIITSVLTVPWLRRFVERV